MIAPGFCFHCGGPNLPGHPCDGRQGYVEAGQLVPVPAAAPLYGGQGDVPYEVESGTSAQAAAAMADDRLAHLEALVYATLAAQPRSCDAVEAETGLPHQTASARIRALVLRDRIVDSGRRETTRHGRRAVVWRVRA